MAFLRGGGGFLEKNFSVEFSTEMSIQQKTALAGTQTKNMGETFMICRICSSRSKGWNVLCKDYIVVWSAQIHYQLRILIDIEDPLS